MTARLDITKNPNWWCNYKYHIIKKYDRDSIPSDRAILDLWKNWNAKIEVSRSTTDETSTYYLVFRSEAEATIFVLKWS